MTAPQTTDPNLGMTLEQARSRIPAERPPAFWVGSIERLEQTLKQVSRGCVRELCRTPGGRPLRSVAYGEREPLPRQANYNSAVGGRAPEVFADRAARRRPVILLIGPVHGQETEALAGLANLLALMETGADLEGREHPDLLAKARACRLLLLPAGNPDGLARFEPESLAGLTVADVRFWGQGTYADHTFCSWPGCKRTHPMQGGAFLGCYFNDAGINPMHDDFFDPMGPEAPAILKLAKDEAPDVAVSLHSHSTAPAILRPAYVPLAVQQQGRDLASRFNDLLAARSLPHGNPPAVTAEDAPVPAPFNLTSALHHICGTLALTFECPHGLHDARSCRVSQRQIVDIQLTLYEALLDQVLA